MSPPAHSSGFEKLPAYALAEVPEILRRLEKRGADIIDLGAGDSNLLPPPAAIRALEAHSRDPEYSGYAFQSGLTRLRMELATWMRRRFGVTLDPEKGLLPLLGSKEGIAKLPLAFLDPGDMAILPDPGYLVYVGGVLLAGGEPYRVPLRPENEFLIPLDDLDPAVLERAKLLYLNYPNNPTTAVASMEYLERAVALCREHDVILVHDHAYSEMAFDGYLPPGALQVDGAEEVVLEFHSFSKTYNMTGWRLGWVAGAESLIQDLARVKTFMDTGPFLAIQAAGVAALESYDDWVPRNMECFRRRRDAMIEGLSSAGFDVRPPRATMYVWVPVPSGESSAEFARRALEKKAVVVLPGSAMGEGGEGFFRIALTRSEDRIREAAVRLGRL